MSERVIDVLEAVEIDQQQRDAAGLAGRVGQCVLETRMQQAAIGQPGQRIVQRLHHPVARDLRDD